MRPQTAHRIVEHGLKPFYKHGYSDLSTLLTKRFSLALNKLIEKDKLDFDKHSDWEYDNRTIEEIYGACLTDEHIFGELHYISDRFNATHRLRFLKYVIDKEQAK